MKMNNLTLNRKLLAIFVVSVFLVSTLLTAAPVKAYPPSTNDWPMFQGNPRHTGVAYPSLGGISAALLAEVWSYTTDNVIGPGSASLADIDGDGELEVLIGTANFASTGGLYALESDGSYKWKYQTGDYGTYDTPNIADVDGDGRMEIAFVSYAGKIVLLEDDGTAKWVVDKASAGTRSLLADLEGDGSIEVVAGAASKIWCLDANGVELWNRAYTVGTSIAFADVDGDGGSELVFSAIGTGTVVALNADGSTQWVSSPAATQDYQVSLAIVNDISGDGKPDVIVGCRDKYVYAYSGADGSRLWSYATVGRVFGIAVGDIEGDGNEEIVATATKGDGIESYVYLLDKSGSLLLSHNVIGAKYYSTAPTPAIVDIDKDGVLDVVVASQNKNFYALSGIDGSELWSFTWTIGGLDASSPAIADLDGDGTMDIVFATGNAVHTITVLKYPLTISVSPVGGGTTNPSAGTYQYESGSSVDVTATAASGYTFDSWFLDGTNAGSLNPITVTMNAPHNLVAQFLSPKAIKSNVLAELQALRATVTDKEDGKKLDEAIKHLTKSLEPELWVGETRLNPKHGEKVFQEEKDAVVKLLDLMKDKKSTIPVATLQGFINRLVSADRLLASGAINDAAGGDAKKIDKANDELGKGDARVADGHFTDAIEHYRNAWKHAIQSV
jgi:hypothetical protein